jgi:hypothetical protein
MFITLILDRGFLSNINLDLKTGRQKMLCCLFVTACVGLISGSLTSCDEVRKVFQLRQIGPVKSLPERPREGRPTVVVYIINGSEYLHVSSPFLYQGYQSNSIIQDWGC